ncbi:MAG: type II secretion system F family protein [Candidatus Altiarchaeota archaeon]|nr:type II secretion system F family protein [Candidatus Altiarchaeota archaeon]
MSVYISLTRLLPKNIKKEFKHLIMCSTIGVNSNKLLGFIILFGLVSGLYLGYLISLFGVLPFIFGFIVAFAVIEAVFYLWILFSVDSKAKLVETVLPDALQLMSSNVRAGLTTDKALLLAARPEFGPLADEIKRMGRETMTGGSLTEALLKTNQRIKSDTLSKTMDLIVNSIKSGGKLADLLDQVSSDLREQQIIQKEITASVLMYVIFIFIAIGLAAPLLFAVSSFLVEVLVTMSTEIGKEMPSSAAMGGFTPGVADIQIDPKFLPKFAIVSLVVSSVFGSLIMGQLMKGDGKEGIKYLPLLIIISIGLFLLGSYVMKIVFGRMIEF